MKSHREKIFLSEQQKIIWMEYMEKWVKYFLSTNRYPSASIAETVTLLYKSKDLKPPKVIHCESPLDFSGIVKSLKCFEANLKNIIIDSSFVEITENLPIVNVREKKIPKTDLTTLGLNVRNQLHPGIQNQIQESEFIFSGTINIRSWLGRISTTDFLVTHMGYVLDPKVKDEWELLQHLFKCCEYIFDAEQVCVVSNFHNFRKVDSNSHLHAIASPAVSYSEIMDLYFHHGYWLPAEYGRFPPSEWKAEWIRQESREDVRQVLIQGIGIQKILDSLNCRKVDSWKEYTLFEIMPGQIAPIPINLKVLSWRDVENDKSIAVEVPLYLDRSKQAALWAERASFHLKKFRGYWISL
ncbi:MAG: hypothetical protein F6K00_35090 [Leptolyngbya sp. SIOISBB]|nr:hypothetical protein [Leptolyngbya sp. SIOISBB]